MTKQELITFIEQYITTNSQNEVSGAIQAAVLVEMVNAIWGSDGMGALTRFRGVASVSTNPGTSYAEDKYLATWNSTNQQTFTHFSGIVVAAGELVVLRYSGSSWAKNVIGTIIGGGGTGEMTAGEIRDALQSLTLTDRLSKSAILGADFALNFQAKYDMSQYTALAAAYPNVKKGDFWICDGLTGVFAVQDGDWVVALDNDAEFANEYQGQDWMVLPFSSMGGSGSMTGAQIVSALNGLTGTARLPKGSIFGADFAINRRGALRWSRGDVQITIDNIKIGDMYVHADGVPTDSYANGDVLIFLTETPGTPPWILTDTTKFWIIQFSKLSKVDEIEYTADSAATQGSVNQLSNEVILLEATIEAVEEALPNITRVTASRSRINGQAYCVEFLHDDVEDFIEVNFDQGNVHRMHVISALLDVSTINSVNGGSYILIFHADVITTISFDSEFINMDDVTLNEGEEVIVSGMRSNDRFLMRASDVFDTLVSNPPILSAILINEGDSGTIDNEVSIEITRSGGVPTAYKISESPTLEGAEPIAYTTDTITFELSETEGTKTVYLRLMNNDGNSAIKNDSIVFVIDDPLIDTVVLKDISTGSALITDSLNVNVFVTLVSPALLLQIRTGNSETFTNEAWQDWDGTSAVQHLISDPDNSESKTVYVQVQNIASVTPSQDSDEIMYEHEPAPVVLTFRLGESETATERNVTLNFTTSGTPNKYKVSENSGFTDCPEWIDIPVGSTPTFDLSTVNAVKTVYFKVYRNSDQVESDFVIDTITLAVPAPTIKTSPAFVLDSGAGTTTDEVVTLNFETTNEPDEYMASENEQFTGAQWLTIPQSAPSFTLSVTDEIKIVYLKVRRTYDDNVESSSVNAGITMAIPTPAFDIVSITNLEDQTADIVLDETTSPASAKTMKILDVAHDTEYQESAWSALTAIAFDETFNYAAAGTGSRDVYVRVYNYNNEVSEEMFTVTITLNTGPIDIDLSGYGNATGSKPSGFFTYAESFCFVAGSETEAFVIDDAPAVIQKYVFASNTIASDFSATLSGFTKIMSIIHKTGNWYFILDAISGVNFDLVLVEIAPSTTGQTITKAVGNTTTIDTTGFAATLTITNGSYDEDNNQLILIPNVTGDNRKLLKLNLTTNTLSKYTALADSWFATNLPLLSDSRCEHASFDPVSGNVLMVVDEYASGALCFVAVFNGTSILADKLVEGTEFTVTNAVREVLIKEDRSKIYLLTRQEGIKIFSLT